jgi:hypothetical protein
VRRGVGAGVLFVDFGADRFVSLPALLAVVFAAVEPVFRGLTGVFFGAFVRMILEKRGSLAGSCRPGSPAVAVVGERPQRRPASLFRSRRPPATLRAPMAPPADPNAAAASVSAAPRERLFTLPLVLFLLGVAGVIAYGLWQRQRVPGPDELIMLLADGDLDRAERDRLLRFTIDAAKSSDDVAHRWAGMLAAVSLGDQEAYAALRARLGGESAPPTPPPAERREFLHLGDPMLANVLAAMVAEAAGDRTDALRRWRQVAAQCYFMARPLAADLAAAGIQRSS